MEYKKSKRNQKLKNMPPSLLPIPVHTKKSIKELELSTLYNFAQAHKVLKKMDFIL